MSESIPQKFKRIKDKNSQPEKSNKYTAKRIKLEKGLYKVHHVPGHLNDQEEKLYMRMKKWDFPDHMLKGIISKDEILLKNMKPLDKQKLGIYDMGYDKKKGKQIFMLIL